MITLATLADATPQQVFDHVSAHLLTQGHRSEDFVSNTCAYRGQNGDMCAAGCLMSDKEYREEFEGADWGTLVSEKNVPPAHEALIARLQSIHDGPAPNTWKEKLQALAERYQFSQEVLERDYPQNVADGN